MYRQNIFSKTSGKAAVPAALAILAAAAVIGGPKLVSAYLTDTESTVNTTTIGKVQVDLEEPHWPGNDSDDVKDIVPNEEIPKDPQMENTGNNDAIFFASYDIPVESLIVAADNGTRQERVNVELFKTSKDELSEGRVSDTAAFSEGTYNNTDWELLKTEFLDASGQPIESGTLASEGTKAVRRLFGYKSRVAKDGKTSPLFTAIKLANVIEGQLEETSKSVSIDSYAIQADYITDIDTSGNALSKDTLQSVYDVYFRQSGSVADKDADTGNDKDLEGKAH